MLGVAGTWAFSTSRSDAPTRPAQESAVAAAPDPAALGLFPHGGRAGAVAAGYRTPVDAVTAYVAEITDPSRLPPGYAVTATMNENVPVTVIDADHADVFVGMQGTGNTASGRIAVQRVSTDPDAWQVTSAMAMAGELTHVVLGDGTVTGSIAPAAGSTATLSAYDLATGELLDATTLSTPSGSYGTPVVPTPFSLDVGDHAAVGLRCWSTLTHPSGYDFPSFTDQAVAAGLSDTGATSTTGEPSPTAVAPTTSDDSSATSTTALHTALDEAMVDMGTVLVVNGSGVAGLGGSLTKALAADGYVVRPPTDATGPVAESVAYVREAAPAAAVALLPAVGRREQLNAQRIPVVASDDVAEADVIVVLGADLADAPWTTTPTTLVSDRHGVLLVLDGSGTPDGRQRTEAQIAALRSAGVEVVDGGATTRPVEQSMLSPIGQATRWTFAVDELAHVGGFDSWTPTLLDGDLPTDVTAVLVVGP
ncbi:MAG: LytR C-terminal domain-containing protein [Ilumatobacteraceae bacterium]